jgi:prepilin-type N-terminal cleavage/methylation domain-containing protein
MVFDMQPIKTSLHKSTAGFTLVEALVVVVIVAILGAIAAPSWLTYANRRRVNAVEDSLVQVLRQAQQQAIQERQRVSTTVANEDGFPVAGSGGVLNRLGPADLPANGIEITSTSPAVAFDYRGAVSEDAIPTVFNITPRNSNIRHCVIVANILGSIKTSSDPDQCDSPSL